MVKTLGSGPSSEGSSPSSSDLDLWPSGTASGFGPEISGSNPDRSAGKNMKSHVTEIILLLILIVVAFSCGDKKERVKKQS
jgi:hypothetical protein